LVERDKLAAELTEVYPPLAEKLADLVGRIAANDPAIERVNQKLPDGAKWLSNAELVARQLSNFLDGLAAPVKVAGVARKRATRTRLSLSEQRRA
jgi:hypothetical protein